MNPTFRKELLAAADGMDIEASRLKYLAGKLRAWAGNAKVEAEEEAKPEPKKKAFDPLNVVLPYETGAFSAAWMDWCEHRAQKRQKLTPKSVELQLKELTALEEADGIAAIRHAIASGWTGMHAKANGKPAKSFAQQDEDRLVGQMTESARRLQPREG